MHIKNPTLKVTAISIIFSEFFLFTKSKNIVILSENTAVTNGKLNPDSKKKNF